MEKLKKVPRIIKYLLLLLGVFLLVLSIYIKNGYM